MNIYTYILFPYFVFESFTCSASFYTSNQQLPVALFTLVSGTNVFFSGLIRNSEEILLFL